MAKLAVVQRYAYDSNANGDAAYNAGLIAHLQSRGHDVCVVTTNMSGGRTRPWFASHYPPTVRAMVRHGLTLGRWRLSLAPSAWLRMAMRIVGARVPARSDASLGAEGKWLVRQIAAHAIDKTLLMGDGTIFASHLAAANQAHGAIPVFLRNNPASFDGATINPATLHLLQAEVAPYRNCALVGFHSNDDVRVARGLGVHHAVKVGIGVAVAAHGAPQRQPQPDTILFVAALASQNVESLDWLLDRVFPLVLAARPGAQLRIVGSIGKALAARDVHGNVQVAGYVDDLAREYAGAALAIAPLIAGSKGMKVKVAEALAHGCPQVATSISIDSDDRTWAGEAMHLADTPEQFAAAIVAILQSPEEQQKLSQGALRAFQDHISCEAAYRAVDGFLAR